MPIDPLNQRSADQQRHYENRGRLAHAYARMKTNGYGTVEFDKRIDFGMTFVERPFIAVGHQIDVPDDWGDFPLATGYVTEWDMTDRDHYIGCWLACVVNLPYTPPSDQSLMAARKGFADEEELMESMEFSGGGGDTYPKVWHDFTFSGIALKDIPITK